MNKVKTERMYIIQYTIDPDLAKWNNWDEKTYASFSSVKEKVWILSQKEFEFNRNEATKDPRIAKILGFRIVEKTVTTTTEIITETLLN